MQLHVLLGHRHQLKLLGWLDQLFLSKRLLYEIAFQNLRRINEQVFRRCELAVGAASRADRNKRERHVMVLTVVA